MELRTKNKKKMKLDETKSTAPEKIPASSCPRQKKLSRIK